MKCIRLPLTTRHFFFSNFHLVVCILLLIYLISLYPPLSHLRSPRLSLPFYPLLHISLSLPASASLPPLPFTPCLSISISSPFSPHSLPYLPPSILLPLILFPLLIFLPFLILLHLLLFPLPQVRQDSWACFLVPSGAIRTPQRQAVEDREDEEEPVLVSASYNWMLSTVSLYLKEVWILIRGDGNQDRSDSGAACVEEKEKDMDKTSSLSYSRADLCEVL